jgi:hypothetical protein
MKALKISSVGKAVRTPFTYNEPKVVEMDAEGTGTVAMHSDPSNITNFWPYFFSNGEIPVKSQALLYDDWTAIEPGEVVKALSEML